MNGTLTALSESPDIPIYVPVVVGIGAAMLVSILTFFSCRCLLRRRRKAQRLMELTPQSSDPRMIGIRASDNIQFVVPTTVQVSETTDESFSETDSGGKLSDREGRLRKKTAVGFQLTPEKLEKTLYHGTNFSDNVGRVGFSLHFDHHRQQICVRLVAAMDLPSYFLKGIANPYAKLLLLPEKAPKYFTRVHRNTLNPVFNEAFVFPAKKADVEQRVLKITLWDYDKFSRKVLIGEALYPVKDAGIHCNSDCDVTSSDIWVNLTLNTGTNLPTCGELLFSLCYSPERSTLTMTVLKTRRLHIDEKEKDTAMYVKATLYVRKKLVRTKKTPSKKKTPDVEFNHSFQIHVPQSALADVDILITLCSKSGIGSKRVIGRTQVGGNCSSEQGIQHWQDMLSSLDSTSAQWHMLAR